MLYAKGGAAWTKDRYSVSHAVYTQFGDLLVSSETRFGWVLGAGVEYAFTRNWTVFVEYNHYDFGSHTTVLATTGVIPAAISLYPFGIKQSLDVAKAGINYRFAGF